MKVAVQFFSRLKDIAGAEREIEMPDGATVEDLLGHIYTQDPHLREWDSTILIGAGLEFVRRDYILRPHETIAIMPPVQGG